MRIGLTEPLPDRNGTYLGLPLLRCIPFSHAGSGELTRSTFRSIRDQAPSGLPLGRQHFEEKAPRKTFPAHGSLVIMWMLPERRPADQTPILEGSYTGLCFLAWEFRCSMKQEQIHQV